MKSDIVEPDNNNCLTTPLTRFVFENSSLSLRQRHAIIHCLL